jgi:uncharacterized membrane protein
MIHIHSYNRTVDPFGTNVKTYQFFLLSSRDTLTLGLLDLKLGMSSFVKYPSLMIFDEITETEKSCYYCYTMCITFIIQNL